MKTDDCFLIVKWQPVWITEIALDKNLTMAIARSQTSSLYA